METARAFPALAGDLTTARTLTVIAWRAASVRLSLAAEREAAAKARLQGGPCPHCAEGSGKLIGHKGKHMNEAGVAKRRAAEAAEATAEPEEQEESADENEDGDAESAEAAEAGEAEAGPGESETS
jgi:hypothetical protein